MGSRRPRPTAPQLSGVTPTLWEQLPTEKMLDILKVLQRRKSLRLKREFPEVLSVGVGHKTTAGELLPTLCIGFLVARKSVSAKQLPKFVRTYVEIDGRRRRVNVPTDVEELSDSGPHSATNAAEGILVASASQPALRGIGAVCCLVKVQGQSDLYVLSCHHVLTLSSKVGGCRIVIDTLVADRQGVPFAQLFEAVGMGPNRPSQIDAAIALVQPGNDVHWNHTGKQPTTVDMGLSKPQNCMVYAPGRQLDAVYVKTWPEVQLPYPGCGTVQIECAYQFSADTHPGDSGSPVIGSDGTLYAMHFWGSPSSNFAMAIPAGYLFRPGTFRSGTLQLA